ncbi:MAG: sugar transporter [Hyphomicrobium sp.]|nr:MAG: sugar transporter [Hyphomicrobium sp.]PPD00076.1 MAG: sugar transporter [Hyphomicrobium sp.]
MWVRFKLIVVCAGAALMAGCASGPDHIAIADAQISADTQGSIKDPALVTSEDVHPVPISSAAAHPADDSAHPVMAVATSSWGEPGHLPSDVIGPQAVADTDGPYLLDTGDRLRIFVYGQPNLSRQYVVDHDGRIAVPLIGQVYARGKTTSELQGNIRARLGADYVKDPQVTVDIQQNRPFFILGEVRSAGQYPYVSGMTVETAIAIAGGYTERASDRKFRITRRVNGFVEQVEAPGDYVVKPGDTIHVFERFL